MASCLRMLTSAAVPSAVQHSVLCIWGSNWVAGGCWHVGCMGVLHAGALLHVLHCCNTSGHAAAEWPCLAHRSRMAAAPPSSAGRECWSAAGTGRARHGQRWLGHPRRCGCQGVNSGHLGLCIMHSLGESTGAPSLERFHLAHLAMLSCYYNNMAARPMLLQG